MTQIAEKKCYDGTGSLNPILTTWTFDSFLEGIVQGTALNQRVGNQIYVKKIYVQFTMSPLVTMPVAGALCRFVMYHNKECNGALPSGASNFTANNWSGVPLFQLKPKISYPRDQTHSYVVTAWNSNGAIGNGAVSAVGPLKVIRMVLYPKTRVDYTANTGAISDVLKHDFGVGFVCTSATSCALDYQFRVEYTDA